MIEVFNEPFYVKYKKKHEEMKAELDEWLKNNDAKESDKLKAEYYRLKYNELWMSDRIRISKLYEEIGDLRKQVEKDSDVKNV